MEYLLFNNDADDFAFVAMKRGREGRLINQKLEGFNMLSIIMRCIKSTYVSDYC